MVTISGVQDAHFVLFGTRQLDLRAFLIIMSSDNFKNLAYYLLTANYSSNQNKLTQPPSNNDSNNNNKGNNKINTPHSQKFQKKSLKHITTTAAVNNKTVSNGLSNANNSLPMQSNNIQRKKHY
ncbi:unnamed protein product, partial [Trichobilharzia regenti]